MSSATTTGTRTSGFEIKFVLDAPLADGIVDWARKHLKPDPYGSGPSGDDYFITNLYFDTDAFDTFHRRGSYGRAKYRARRYGDDEGLFLGRKLRKDDRVNKRRTKVRVDEMSRLNGNESLSGWSGNWFHRRLHLRSLQPVCQVAYWRTARVGTGAHGPIRLTADRAIRVWGTRELVFVNGPGQPIEESKILVEFKFTVAMPVLFEQLVEDFKLEPVQVSKYRMGVGALYRLEDSPDTEFVREEGGSGDA